MGGFHLMIALLILRQLQFDNKLCSQGWVKSAPARTVPHLIGSVSQVFGTACADCPSMPAAWRLDADDGQETVEASWLASRTGYGRSAFKLACAQLSAVSLKSVIRLQSP